MLSHGGGGGFTHCNSLSQNPVSKSLLFPTKPHLNFTLNQVSQPKLPSFHAKIRTGFCVSASKTPKKANKTLLQVEEIEDDDDVEEFDDDDDDEEYDEDELFEGDGEDGDEDDVDVRELSGNYKEWLKSNKPKGFGEGKVYDTSLEDKLLAEIKQSKTAQAANVNNLKNNPKKDGPKKQKAKEATPSGVPVRMTNLPRKKNIDRDLRAAFKGFPGILHIVPVVAGNKKTREPSCKGLAFVYFKSQTEANRFVELFSGQILNFGKIQKKINCEVMTKGLPNATEKQAVNKNVLPLLPVDPSSEIIIPQLVTKSEGAVDENVSKTRLYTGILDNFTSLEPTDVDTHKPEEESATDAGIIENFSSLESIDGDSQELEEDSESDADPLKNQKENEVKKKNVSSKRKGEKTRKTKSLGSANRLKFKDKTLLTGIVSKYGVKPDLPAK